MSVYRCSVTGRLYRQSIICPLILSTNVVAKGCVNLRCGAVTGFTSFKDGTFLRKTVFQFMVLCVYCPDDGGGSCL